METKDYIMKSTVHLLFLLFWVSCMFLKIKIIIKETWPFLLYSYYRRNQKAKCNLDNLLLIL